MTNTDPIKINTSIQLEAKTCASCVSRASVLDNGLDCGIHQRSCSVGVASVGGEGVAVDWFKMAAVLKPEIVM